ncbi:MAG TPA: D-alanyl-D-alanine carboxypeptidase/D-alanyl-D-alanine-endopeptidase [Gemmatimonadaceae bacterium]|nr:D-alanyl-D-alanine carboxypeptidase/D-alanyl-D-alanine-endopeptidase [Gemmatimonadaceae bacterium]
MSAPYRLASLSISIALAGCASAGALSRQAGPSRGGRAALRASIDSLTAADAFANAHWGILIVDPATGDTLYSQDAGKLFMPASNMKIMTAATALELLGPDYTYRTSIVARGPIVGDTLGGDLVVVGRGDPTVSDHMRVDAMLPLRAMAESLSARGITRISGRVIPGGNVFPGPTLGFGWAWDDLEDSYSAAVDELLFNEGFSEIHVYGGARPGDAARVETRPARTVPRVYATVRTVEPPPPCTADTTSVPACDTASEPPLTGARARPEVTARKDTVAGTVLVAGTIAAGDSLTIEVTHRDPDAAYVDALREAIRARGIVVGEHAPADTGLRGDTLFVMQSPPLREILPALLKPSQNQIAEELFRTLGLERTGVGTADSGRVVVQRQITTWGARPGGFVIRDGSGLSRYDYLTPETIVHVLDAMRRSPNFATFYDALPIAGVDGTIRNRMKGTPAEGNVHAKTGTLANARSLSGYVRTADGRTLIFSILCNNWTVPVREVDRVADTIAVRLASLQGR